MKKKKLSIFTYTNSSQRKMYEKTIYLVVIEIENQNK